MKITKIGHCCLLIEVEGKRILTDPGSFTVEGLMTENIDIVLITHEHADHLHIDSVKKIIEASPAVQIFSNSSVGKLLTQAGITFGLLEGIGTTTCCGIAIEAFDGKHEEIYEEIGQVQNTGYFVAGKLFYPGDSYIVPDKHVEVLAFPLGGPWCKIADAIRYVLAVKPAHAFPVHDGIEREDRVGILHRIPTTLFPEHGINFHPMKASDTKVFN
jgi:L-ascorbate metabolism protein UlaG (beta-lactamase superfamily)